MTGSLIQVSKWQVLHSLLISYQTYLVIIIIIVVIIIIVTIIIFTLIIFFLITNRETVRNPYWNSGLLQLRRLTSRLATWARICLLFVFLCCLCFLLLSFVLFCLLWLEFVFCLFSFAAFVLLSLLWIIFSFTSSNGFQIKNIFTFFNLQNILYLSNSKKGFVLSISSCVCLKSFITFSCLNKRNCLRKTFEFVMLFVLRWYFHISCLSETLFLISIKSIFNFKLFFFSVFIEFCP